MIESPLALAAVIAAATAALYTGEGTQRFTISATVRDESA